MDLAPRGACMECRRLKTKCDRAVPCAPCKKRGCDNICPDGLRARGTRNPTAEIESLTKHIQTMALRIRQLEGSLQAAQASQSSQSSGSSPTTGGHDSSGTCSSELLSLTLSNLPADDQTKMVERINLLRMLPTEDFAVMLIDKYFNDYGWLIRPISRDRVTNVLLGRAYTVPCAATDAQLSALFSIFAMATAGERQNPTPWLTSAQLYEASMTALQLNEVLTEVDIETIEAMLLQCCYLYFSSDLGDIQKSWNYCGVVVRMAFGMDLHRDPTTLGLGDEECQRRRRVFYELITLDAWESMVSNRPPATQPSLFSTIEPLETIIPIESNPDFFRWKYSFIRNVVYPLINEVLCCPQTPSYSAILQIDKLIHEHTFPESLQCIDFRTAPLHVLLPSQQLLLMKEVVLMKLHKQFFLGALKERPDNPFQQPSGYSVSTELDCSRRLLKRLRMIVVDCERSLPPINVLWEAALACLGVLSTYIRQDTHSSIARELYIEFEMGCKLVADRSGDTRRLSQITGQVYELRHKVHQAVPHLMNELRQALAAQTEPSPRNVPEHLFASNSGIVALEYPLGPPAHAAPQPLGYMNMFQTLVPASDLEAQIAGLTEADFDFDVYEDMDRELLDQLGATGY